MLVWCKELQRHPFVCEEKKLSAYGLANRGAILKTQVAVGGH